MRATRATGAYGQPNGRGPHEPRSEEDQPPLGPVEPGERVPAAVVAGDKMDLADDHHRQDRQPERDGEIPLPACLLSVSAAFAYGPQRVIPPRN